MGLRHWHMVSPSSGYVFIWKWMWSSRTFFPSCLPLSLLPSFPMSLSLTSLSISLSLFLFFPISNMERALKLNLDKIWSRVLKWGYNSQILLHYGQRILRSSTCWSTGTPASSSARIPCGSSGSGLRLRKHVLEMVMHIRNIRKVFLKAILINLTH